MKSSKGQLENGTVYDFTRVFIETELDAATGKAKGFSAEDYKYGNSDNFGSFKHLEFPFFAEVEFDLVTSGSKSVTNIVSITPSARVAGAVLAQK
ncbi:hypothetical protein [Zoogloea oleivorans]|nr:hypothetical protein [Zoogloea oleivorans]